MSSTRQLAAIMFTDIVGYTNIMGRDEQKAFEFLKKNRELQKPIIEQYHGRWIKELGDGVMASFSTVSDAVHAAIKIQEACNASKDFLLRIGIHHGEVVFEETDVFGDAVNIASRIQALASPGGIWISESVHQNVSNKSDIETEFVKTEILKNVKDPVHIYRIKLPGSEPVRPLKKSRKIITGGKEGRKKKFYIAGFLTIILIISVYFLYTVFLDGREDNRKANQAESTDKSIAVLPFKNYSNDQSQEYFSDGLSEELLNLLTRVPGLKVIARTSSFSFKGKNVDVRTIGEKLGVDHVLDGTVQKEENQIRITAQLIRASDGKQLWNKRYDRDMKGVFQLQDEIAEAVVKELELTFLGLHKASKSSNTEVYNLILQGNFIFDRLDQESVAKAIDFYNRALALDSMDDRVWAALANAYSRQGWQKYIDENTAYEKARQASFKAIQINNKQARAYLELGDIKLYHDFDFTGAAAEFQKAITLEPRNAEIMNSMAVVEFTLGSWDKAIEMHRKVLELDPLRPIYYNNQGANLTYAGRYDEAAASYKEILKINPKFQRVHMYLGRIYLLQNKPQKALDEMHQETIPVFKEFGLALCYHALNRKKEADQALSDFTHKYQEDWPYLLATIYAYRGEADKAFEWLEKAYQQRDSWLTWIKGDPLLKNIWNDQRYRELLMKMKLPV